MTGGDIFCSHVRLRDLTTQSPVILHAPHGGRAIPSRFRGAFTIGDAELESELDAMTDHRTDELAASVPGVSHVINGLSRFVVDVERFDDESEEMNAVGMGVLYTHGSRGQRIRTIPDTDGAVLKGFFAEYSAQLERLTDTALARHGRAVIIDVHSFPAVALPYERHADEARPELCVGFEAFHASDTLLASVAKAFADFERIANQPFHGSYVPTKYYRRDPRVQSVMLEIRRDVYQADHEGGLTAIQEALRRLIELAV